MFVGSSGGRFWQVNVQAPIPSIHTENCVSKCVDKAAVIAREEVRMSRRVRWVIYQ
eukprot:COSAG02_NODE_4383_length_5424_cov_2.023099_4_plen_56_part_00